MEKLLLSDLTGMTDKALLTKMTQEFQIERSALEPLDILVGYLEQADWSGDAYFLVRDRATGELYEVTGSHCSCMGFEGQWEPKITSKAYLLSENYRYRGDKEIKQFVTELFSE